MVSFLLNHLPTFVPTYLFPARISFRESASCTSSPHSYTFFDQFQKMAIMQCGSTSARLMSRFLCHLDPPGYEWQYVRSSYWSSISLLVADHVSTCKCINRGGLITDATAKKFVRRPVKEVELAQPNMSVDIFNISRWITERSDDGSPGCRRIE